MNVVTSAGQSAGIARELTRRFLELALPLGTFDFAVLSAVAMQQPNVFVEAEVLSLVAAVHARLVLDVWVGARFDQKSNTFLFKM